MKLRTIAILLYGHPRELAFPFNVQTRCLCNFIQRYARSLKIETSGFNQIVIQDDLFDRAKTLSHLIPEKTLAVPFRVDVARYQRATPEDKQNYFIEILSLGLQHANEFQTLPLQDLLLKAEEFKINGFHNHWVHQSKNIRSHGLVAELQCELTMEEFKLTLEVRRKIGPPVRLPILSTKPDELCFHYKFKDITVREDHLVVTNHINDELVRFPLSPFLAQQD